jgi:hypothetical protein
MTLEQVLLVQEELISDLFGRVEALERRPCSCTHATDWPDHQAEYPAGHQTGRR